MIYVGAKAPQSLRGTIQRGQSDVDLTTATGITFDVVKPSGARVTWTGGAILSATTTTLSVKYTFALGDVDEAGVYHILPHILVPGGQIDGRAFSERVLPWPPEAA
jgi:hypothetical protein